MSIGLHQIFAVSAVLFSIGFFGLLLRKNLLIIFMSIEMLFAASNLVLVGISRHYGFIDGMILAVFTLISATVEIAIGIALVMRLYQQKQSISLSDLEE